MPDASRAAPIAIDLTVNGKPERVEAPADIPLLWVLRDRLGLTGTKFGCGMGACGACTVLDGDRPIRACQVPVGALAGHRLTTIEGLAAGTAHPLQQAWLEEDVAQCGYCQPGMLMEIAALLGRRPQPTRAELDRALADHLCRCGSYPRILRAVTRVTSGAGR